MSEQRFDNGFFGPPRAENGFSIIEMLIAIAVIVFGLVSIAGISAYISRTNSTSATLNVLAAAAQDQVDRLRTARWTRTYSDPMLSIGGYVPNVAGSSLPEPSLAKPMFSPTVSLAQTGAAGFFSSPITSALPTPTPTGGTYTYILDPENPHQAKAVGTAAGDLNIAWQVRQGATADLRYVTIRVVQVDGPPQLADGITVTTIIVRN